MEPISIHYPLWALFHSLSHFEQPDEALLEELRRGGYEESRIEEQCRRVGSKFDGTFARSPREAVSRLVAQYPDRFRQASEADGRLRLSFRLNAPIGTSRVVAEEALTEEERATIRTELRDGCEVRTVLTERAFPTDECQLILEGNTPAFTFISLFAGEAAPKLSRPGETPDPYWLTHLFIRDND